jgi:Xaa-Pro aminopeptidase
MHPEEVERYRKIGRLAAEAMTEVMSRAEPTWTEYRLAGEGANACWSRGLEPTLCLVSGERRGKIHRHPIAKDERLGSRAMLVFCARGHGLYANLTRFVYFSKPTGEEFDNWTRLQKVEAAVLDATRPGTTISSIYETLKSAYASVGRGEEIDNHHQGGPCGYLSREAIARPSSPSSEKVEAMMPFAWNPSLPATKLEDTVLATASGAVEILTVDPKWPTVQVGSRARPDLLIRA